VSVVGPVVALTAISPATGACTLVGYGAIGLVLLRFDRTMVRLVREENPPSDATRRRCPTASRT
jgi:hypothetical protein